MEYDALARGHVIHEQALIQRIHHGIRYDRAFRFPADTRAREKDFRSFEASIKNAVPIELTERIPGEHPASVAVCRPPGTQVIGVQLAERSRRRTADSHVDLYIDARSIRSTEKLTVFGMGGTHDTPYMRVSNSDLQLKTSNTEMHAESLPKGQQSVA